MELDADAVMQAGDFGIWTHTKSGVKFLVRLEQYLDKHNMPLYFVDGNHENFDHLLMIKIDPDGFRTVTNHIFHIPRGHAFNFNGTRIMGFGGANSIDGPNGAPWWGVQNRGMVKTTQFYSEDEIQRRNLPPQFDLGNWWPQEEITQEQVDQVEPEPVDILLTHECPQGIQIPGIDKTYHEGQRQRQLIREVVDKVTPKLLIHGHYHIRHSGPLNNSDTKVIGLGANNGTLHDLIHFIDTDEEIR